MGLNLPSAGLENAALAADLAYGLMARNRNAQALKYATIAGNTYSSWGLLSLATCRDRLGDPDAVNALLQANVERYPDIGGKLRWYAWAKRLGRPDTPAIKKVLQDTLDAHPNDQMSQASLLLLDGQYGPALAIMKAHENQFFNMSQRLHYIVAAAEAGNFAIRDVALEQAAAVGGINGYQEVTQAMLAINKGADAQAAVLNFERRVRPQLKY